MHITFETRKRNTGFYVLRQGVPEGPSSEGYASLKQIKSWPWRVEVFPGVSVRCRDFFSFLSVLRHSHSTLLMHNRCEVSCERCRRCSGIAVGDMLELRKKKLFCF